MYRLFSKTSKLYVKIGHALVQVGAMVLASVGLRAVFAYHNSAGYPNMYSLHSWLGLFTVILFGLQWVFGFVSFLFPKLSEGIRRFYLPHHKFWGLVIFGMACATALMGITEKAIWSITE